MSPSIIMSDNRRRISPADGATPFDIEQDALRRRAAKARKLGTLTPACAQCGEADDDMLTKARASLLEDHHPMQLHEGPTIILCLNCHAKASAQARLQPHAFTSRKRSELERIAAFLYNRSLHNAALAEADMETAFFFLELNKRILPEIYADIPSPFIRKRERDE